MIHPQVFSALQKGTDVLVPRSRLKRELESIYGTRQSHSVWAPPRIFVIGEWIREQLSPSLSKKGIALLSSAPAALLWENALTELPSSVMQKIGGNIGGGGPLRQRFIRQAQQAWRLIHLYDISQARQDYREFFLPSFFHDWALRYRQLCSDKKVMDEWQAVQEFNRLVYEGSLVPPPSLWTGWTYMPPLYEKTVEFLRTGIHKTSHPKILPLIEERKKITYACNCYDDEKEELRQLARQVVAFHEDNSHSHIGVVIPNLEESWYRVRQVFRAAFAIPLLGEEARAPFDMSWGERLEAHPLIGDILNILSLTAAPHEIGDMLEFFRSPYIRAAAEEQESRFALKNALVTMSRRQSKFSIPAALSQGSFFAHCPRLRRSLQDFFAVRGAYRPQASPRHWAKVFNGQLESLGWGAVESWSAQELYLRERWESMLDSLYAVHRVLPLCSRERALAFLRAQAQALFQPRGGQKRVSLLGIREAEGLSFDKLFVCQMDESAVPRPSANFFIPYRLGQAANVPGYGLESHWQTEQRILHQLLHAAPAIEFSYARRTSGEERLLHPQLRHIAVEQTPTKDSFVAEKPALEFCEDAVAPPVAADAELRSLVQLIKEQAACPFRAFARFRLNIREPSQLEEQLAANERGSMLHRMFKKLWEQLRSQERLKNMPARKLARLIRTTAHEVVVACAAEMVFLRTEIIAEVEEENLVDLATKALGYEKERAHGFHIYALEEKRELKNFCGYDFSFHIDRIDKISPPETRPSLMVWDYKNTVRPLSWKSLEGERPDEPQLLVYSLLVVDGLRSLGFLILNLKGGIRTTGIALAETGLPDYQMVSLVRTCRRDKKI